MPPVIDEHRLFLADAARISMFRRAINDVVKSGDIVMDLGAGTGIMGLMSCRAGAKKIYTIDEGGIIEVARRAYQVNGFHDRVVFIKALSTQVDLPEKVDVVVADQIGNFGFDAGLLQYFSDARERFLRPDGILIPSRLDLHIAPVESSRMWERIEFWADSPAGFDFGPVRSLAVNTTYPTKFRPDDLLGDPALAASINLSVATAAPFDLEATIIATRAGYMHGVGGWFSAQLSPDVIMSNSPLAPHPINRMNLFFPIDQPVDLNEGDCVQVKMHIRPVDLVITWRVEVLTRAREQEAEISPVKKASFTHSTWKGMLICGEDLKRTRPDFIPALTPRGEARLSVLELCDGRTTVSEIEREIYRRHPSMFQSLDDAAAFVAEVVKRYSK